MLKQKQFSTKLWKELLQINISNTLGVREYDPSGKYERERAEFWRNRAKELKEHGLLLFAEALEDAARRYELEGNMDDL